MAETKKVEPQGKVVGIDAMFTGEFGNV